MAALVKAAKVMLIILGTRGKEDIPLDLGTVAKGDKTAAGKMVDKKIGNLANEGPRISCVKETNKLVYEELDDGTHQYTCSPPHTGGNKRRKKSKKTKKRKITKKRKTIKKK